MADKQSTYVIDDNSNLIRSFEETTDNVAIRGISNVCVYIRL